MFWRAAAAFLLSPIVVALGMAATTKLNADSLTDQAIEVLVLALLVYIYALFFALVLALPLYLLLNYFGLVNRWVSVSAGLVIGGLGVAWQPAQGLWQEVWLVVLSGIAGLVFWRVVSTYQPPKATW